MSLLGTLFGRPATDAVTALGNVFDKLFTSDEERAQANIILTKIAQKPHLLQAEINKVEAAHRSIFVAGWRPFIGWICGLGILWAFLGHPLFQWVVALQGLTVDPPAIDTDHLLELVLAMLGLGALRTAEKLTGRSK
ncbi:MAG: 3TM-type holin [Pseudomonadota bacterium]